MKTIRFDALPKNDREILRAALKRTAYSLNKLTGPQLSATFQSLALAEMMAAK